MDPLLERLYATTDAQVWAEEFMKVVETGATIDFGLMVGWFANAIATAKGQAELKAAKLAVALRLTQEYVGDETLPPLPGWSWYDALKEYNPAMVVEKERA